MHTLEQEERRRTREGRAMITQQKKRKSEDETMLFQFLLNPIFKTHNKEQYQVFSL